MTVGLTVHGVDVVPLLLAWIGAVSLVWVVAHGWILCRQWRSEQVRPGVLGGGLWVMFASMGTVTLAGVTRRAFPDLLVLRAIAEVALVGVAVAVTWLAFQLLRLWR